MTELTEVTENILPYFMSLKYKCSNITVLKNILVDIMTH